MNKGIRFLLELLVVAAALFVLLFGIGQIESLIGMTSEATEQYSFIMLIAHIIIVYIVLNATLYRWLPLQFFRRKNMDRMKQIVMLIAAFAILIYVFIMTK